MSYHRDRWDGAGAIAAGRRPHRSAPAPAIRQALGAISMGSRKQVTMRGGSGDLRVVSPTATPTTSGVGPGMTTPTTLPTRLPLTATAQVAAPSSWFPAPPSKVGTVLTGAGPQRPPTSSPGQLSPGTGGPSGTLSSGLLTGGRTPVGPELLPPTPPSYTTPVAPSPELGPVIVAGGGRIPGGGSTTSLTSTSAGGGAVQYPELELPSEEPTPGISGKTLLIAAGAAVGLYYLLRKKR